MILDFKLIQRKEMWCPESAAASIATLYNRRFEMMFSDFWMFEFLAEDTNQPGMVGNRIATYENNIFTLLLKYHGIESKYIKTKNIKEIFDITELELKLGHPVVTNFDSFYSPWAPDFEKNNRFKSAYVILGIDYERKGILCFDMHFHRKIELLPFVNFECGAENLITYSIRHDEIEFDWQEVIKQQVSKLYGVKSYGNSFQSIREFANSLRNQLNYDIEFKQKKDYSGMNDMHTVPILKNLTSICRSRGLYAMTLQFIAEKYNIPELTNISQKMEVAGSKWSQVFSLLYKGAFASSFTDKMKSNVYDKLYMISDFEEKLAESLTCLGQSISYEKKDDTNKKLYLTDEQSPYCPKHEIVFIGLEKYYNNKGLYCKTQDQFVPGLNGVGDYFVLEGFPYGKILELKETQFFIPATLQKDNADNIICNGQKIDVENSNYSSIMLLGYSDFMNHYETMKIILESEAEIEIPLQFTYWFNTPRCGEEIAWKGLLIRKMADSKTRFTFSANIFSQRYSLDRTKRIKAIILPKCLDIHIFAISMSR